MKKRFACLVCGKVFYAYGDRKVCSKKCAAESMKKRVPVLCRYCGKTVYKPPSLAYRVQAKHFCNKECMRRNQIKEANTKRKSTAYESWRQGVLKRDNHTCQVCGAKEVGNKLKVHHPKSQKLFPQLILNTSNGVTLCAVCHSKLHRRLEREDLIEIPACC